MFLFFSLLPSPHHSPTPLISLTVLRINAFIPSGCHSKVQWMRCLKQQKRISHNSGDQKTQVSVGLVSPEAFLACRWLFPPRVFTWSSLWVQIPSPYKNTSQIGLGSTLMASFQLNYTFKDYLQIHSQYKILKVRTSAYECGGWDIQFNTLTTEYT